MSKKKEDTIGKGEDFIDWKVMFKLWRSNKNLKYAAAALCGVVLAYFIVGWMNSYFGLQPDNAIEEKIEQVIEVTTGVDLDLTPGSNE